MANCSSATSMLASRVSNPMSASLASYYVPGDSSLRRFNGGRAPSFTVSAVAIEIYSTGKIRFPTLVATKTLLLDNNVRWRRRRRLTTAASKETLDLTEENVRRVLEEEAREELGQIFDPSAGITGVAELADLDGPFVKIRLRGKFWHERSMVVARLSNFLKQRIPEVLEVEIEDEKQLDDSPANF